MKNLTLSHFLLNSLIDIDLLILKKHYILRNLNVFSILKLHKKLFLHLINPLDFIVSFKQFFRIIFFLKKNKGTLNFFVDGLHHKSIVNAFFSLNKLNIKFKIFFKFLALKKSSYEVLFLLKAAIPNYFSLSRLALTKHVYLIQEINLSVVKNCMGCYKIFNNISDYKKLIFLLTFIKQI